MNKGFNFAAALCTIALSAGLGYEGINLALVGNERQRTEARFRQAQGLRNLADELHNVRNQDSADLKIPKGVLSSFNACLSPPPASITEESSQNFVVIRDSIETPPSLLGTVTTVEPCLRKAANEVANYDEKRALRKIQLLLAVVGGMLGIIPASLIVSPPRRRNPINGTTPSTPNGA